jgi:hypothetical protein
MMPRNFERGGDTVQRIGDKVKWTRAYKREKIEIVDIHSKWRQLIKRGEKDAHFQR